MGSGPLTHVTTGETQNMKVVLLLTLAPFICWADSPAVCFSKKGNQCQFPFIYEEIAWDYCITWDSENGEPWCQTTDGRYEDCEDDCPGVYCTTFDSENGEPWCQTTSGRYEDYENLGYFPEYYAPSVPRRKISRSRGPVTF